MSNVGGRSNFCSALKRAEMGMLLKAPKAKRMIATTQNNASEQRHTVRQKNHIKLQIIAKIVPFGFNSL